VGGDDEAKIDAVLKNDPSRNILNILGDNRDASIALLSGETWPGGRTGGGGLIDARKGLRAAQDLVDPRWAIPNMDGKGDGAAAKVIQVATTPRRLGSGADLQTWAAANVFQAADYAQQWLDKRTEMEKQQFPRLPDRLTRALGGTARAYLYDLAISTNTTQERVGGDEVVASAERIGPGVFQVQADLFTVDSVLRLVSVDTTEWGALQGAVDAQVVAAAATQERDPFGPIALRGTGALAGIVMSIDQHRVRDRIDEEAAGTARAAMYQKILVTGGADAATAAVGGAAPPLGIVLAAATPWVTESLSGPPARDYTPIAHAILVGRGRFKQQIAQG
jgi:hypothetical protein